MNLTEITKLIREALQSRTLVTGVAPPGNPGAVIQVKLDSSLNGQNYVRAVCVTSVLGACVLVKVGSQWYALANQIQGLKTERSVELRHRSAAPLNKKTNIKVLYSYLEGTSRHFFVGGYDRSPIPIYTQLNASQYRYTEAKINNVGPRKVDFIVSIKDKESIYSFGPNGHTWQKEKYPIAYFPFSMGFWIGYDYLLSTSLFTSEETEIRQRYTVRIQEQSTQFVDRSERGFEYPIPPSTGSFNATYNPPDARPATGELADSSKSSSRIENGAGAWGSSYNAQESMQVSRQYIDGTGSGGGDVNRSLSGGASQNEDVVYIEKTLFKGQFLTEVENRVNRNTQSSFSLSGTTATEKIQRTGAKPIGPSFSKRIDLTSGSSSATNSGTENNQPFLVSLDFKAFVYPSVIGSGAIGFKKQWHFCANENSELILDPPDNYLHPLYDLAPVTSPNNFGTFLILYDPDPSSFSKYFRRDSSFYTLKGNRVYWFNTLVSDPRNPLDFSKSKQYDIYQFFNNSITAEILVHQILLDGTFKPIKKLNQKVYRLSSDIPVTAQNPRGAQIHGISYFPG